MTIATHTDDPGHSGTNSNSLFVRFAEHRIAIQQAQLARARQLVEQYRNTQDMYEMIDLQTELLTLLSGHNDFGHDDNMMIAAKFAGALYRLRGAIIDPEAICEVLTNLHLSPPSAPAPMPTDSYSEDVESSWSISHSVTHTEGFSSGVSHTAPHGHHATAKYVHRASLHAALFKFRIALELGGPLTIDDAAWLVRELAKIILDLSA